MANKGIKMMILDSLEKIIERLKIGEREDYRARQRDERINNERPKITNDLTTHDEMVYGQMVSAELYKEDPELLAQLDKQNEKGRFSPGSKEQGFVLIGTFICGIAVDKIGDAAIPSEFKVGIATITVLGAAFEVERSTRLEREARTAAKQKIWAEHKIVFREEDKRRNEIVYSMYVGSRDRERVYNVGKVYLHVTPEEDKQLEAQGINLKSIGSFMASYDGVKNTNLVVLRFEDIDGYAPELGEDVAFPEEAKEEKPTITERVVERKVEEVHVIKEHFREVMRHKEKPKRQEIEQTQDEPEGVIRISEIKAQAEEQKKIQHEERAARNEEHHKNDIEL